MQWRVVFSLLGLVFTSVRAQPQTTMPIKHKAKSVSTAKTQSSSRTRSRKGRKLRAKAAPSYQLHPDPQRYQEIQKALAGKGYFKGEANGEWGNDSVDAMKRFQADQKLPDDGKLSSLTLQGLGLGAKHDGSTAQSYATPLPPAAVPIPPAAEPPQSSVSTPPN